MAVPASGEFVAQVVVVTGFGATRRYLQVFMAFARTGTTAAVTRLMPNALDGTPRFALAYTLGAGVGAWQPWTGIAESDAPVGGKVLINGSPVVVEEPPDDLIG